MKPLYQPWDEEAFRADIHVSAMTPTQRWIYRTLLQAAFVCSTRPYLPNDDNVLWLLAGCTSKKQWMENKSRVWMMFREFSSADGMPLLAQKRVEEDWNRIQDKQVFVTEVRRAAAGARWEKESTSYNPQALQVHSSSNTAVDARDANNAKGREGKRIEKNIIEGKEVDPDLPSAVTEQDWKTFAIRYHSLFGGRHIGSGRQVRQDFTEACRRYGFEAVLECFCSWAADARERLGGKRYPIGFFWKDLPLMAEAVLAKRGEDGVRAADEEKGAEQAERDREAMARVIADDQGRVAREVESRRRQKDFEKAHESEI